MKNVKSTDTMTNGHGIKGRGMMGWLFVGQNLLNDGISENIELHCLASVQTSFSFFS